MTISERDLQHLEDIATDLDCCPSVAFSAILHVFSKCDNTEIAHQIDEYITWHEFFKGS